MPGRDGVSSHNLRLVGSAAIGSNQALTAFGAVINTQDHDSGIGFYVGLSAFTDGVFTADVQTADDASFTQNVETLTSEHIVEQPTVPVAIANAALTAGVTNMTRIGVHSTRKFVRLRIAAASVTSGATVLALALMKTDLSPSGARIN